MKDATEIPKDAEGIFKAIDAVGWNMLNLNYSGATPSTEKPFKVIFWNREEHHYKTLWEIFYDKTPKNFCQCIAEIEANKAYAPLGYRHYPPYKQQLKNSEKEIRHKLLCEEGDNWVEKIQEFLK